MTDVEPWIPVATVDEIGEQTPKQVVIGGETIAVYRVGQEFYAISDICTHQLAYLSEGFVEGCFVECPLHQAKFDILTGKVMTGPAKRDLRKFPVKVTGDQIFVVTSAYANPSHAHTEESGEG